MSGHSKWAQIKRKKAVTDAKRGAIFSKIAKEIMVAARLGGSDPNGNFRLRFAIEKAKANLVPQNNVQRAIEKGAGIGNEGINIEEIIYEGYGPGGAAILVLCTTDNKKRTVSDLRSYFTKYHGKMAEAGAVSWMFIKRGEIKIPYSAFDAKDRSQKNVIARSEATKQSRSNHSESIEIASPSARNDISHLQDKIYELAIEAGAEDIDFNDEDNAVIITKAEELEKVQKNIIIKNIKPTETKIAYNPKEHIEIIDVDLAKNIVKLLEAIEDHDDVQEVYCNFDIKDEILGMVTTG